MHHLDDVDRTRGMLMVGGKGGKMHRITLGSRCLRHLFSYLDQAYPGKRNALVSRKTGDDPLFLTEQGHRLTKSGLTSLMSRTNAP
jgi:site-specific recombinase XerD